MNNLVLEHPSQTHLINTSLNLGQNLSQSKFSSTKFDQFGLCMPQMSNLEAEEWQKYFPIICGKRQIKPKMITKLLVWLQKISKQTLGFSMSTLQITSRILCKYLAEVDQQVSNLQLLGCTCIYLASKMNESVIVAAESFVALSCELFTERQLMQKESKIYSLLWQHTNFKKLTEIYENLSAISGTQNRHQMLETRTCDSYSQISMIIENKSEFHGSVFQERNLFRQEPFIISDSNKDRIEQYIEYCIKDIQLISYPARLVFLALLRVVKEEEQQYLEGQSQRKMNVAKLRSYVTQTRQNPVLQKK